MVCYLSCYLLTKNSLRYLELKEEDLKKIRGTAKVARKIEKIINP